MVKSEKSVITSFIRVFKTFIRGLIFWKSEKRSQQSPTKQIFSYFTQITDIKGKKIKKWLLQVAILESQKKSTEKVTYFQWTDILTLKLHIQMVKIKKCNNFFNKGPWDF